MSEQFFKAHIKTSLKERIEQINKTFISSKCIWIEGDEYFVIVSPNGNNRLISMNDVIEEIYSIFLQSMAEITTKYNIESEIFITAMFNYYQNCFDKLFSINNRALYESCISSHQELPNDEIIEFFYKQINKCNKDVKKYIFEEYFLEDILQIFCKPLFDHFCNDLDNAFL
jgi:hypothetical protein